MASPVTLADIQTFKTQMEAALKLAVQNFETASGTFVLSVSLQKDAAGNKTVAVTTTCKYF